MEKPWKGDTMLNRKIFVFLPLGEGADKTEIFCATFRLPRRSICLIRLTA